MMCPNDRTLVLLQHQTGYPLWSHRGDWVTTWCLCSGCYQQVWRYFGLEDAEACSIIKPGSWPQRSWLGSWEHWDGWCQARVEGWLPCYVHREEPIQWLFVLCCCHLLLLKVNFSMPLALHEFAMEPVQANIHPMKIELLYEKIKYIIKKTIEASVKEYHIPILESLRAFIVPGTFWVHVPIPMFNLN